MPAGSRKGEHRGGRKKGTRNHASVKREAEIAASGLTPLQYMMQRLRDESLSPTERLDAAKAAAPYVHPRLNSVDMRASADVVTEVRRTLVDPRES